MSDPLAEVVEFCTEYNVRFNKRPPLNVVNKRFGVKLKRETGRSLLALLKDDQRFTLILMESGAREVALEALEVSEYKPVQSQVSYSLKSRILKLIESRGALKLQELSEELAGSGFKTAELMDALVELNGEGKIQASGGLYSLPAKGW